MAAGCIKFKQRNMFALQQTPRVSLRVLGLVLFKHQVDVLLEGLLLEGFRLHELQDVAHVGRVIQGFLETVANVLVAEVDDPVVEIFWTSCGQVHLRERAFKLACETTGMKKN